MRRRSSPSGASGLTRTLPPRKAPAAYTDRRERDRKLNVGVESPRFPVCSLAVLPPFGVRLVSRRVAPLRDSSLRFAVNIAARPIRSFALSLSRFYYSGRENCRKSLEGDTARYSSSRIRRKHNDSEIPRWDMAGLPLSYVALTPANKNVP